MLGVDGHDRVVVVSRQSMRDGPVLVYKWLRAAAAAVLEARTAKAARGTVTLSDAEQKAQLPTSLEELVAYVGFTN